MLRSLAKSMASSVMSVPNWMVSVRPRALLVLYPVRLACHLIHFRFYIDVMVLEFDNLLVLNKDGGREGTNDKADKIFGGELPALAKEVARLETVRVYAG